MRGQYCFWIGLRVTPPLLYMKFSLCHCFGFLLQSFPLSFCRFRPCVSCFPSHFLSLSFSCLFSVLNGILLVDRPQCIQSDPFSVFRSSTPPALHLFPVSLQCSCFCSPCLSNAFLMFCISLQVFVVAPASIEKSLTIHSKVDYIMSLPFSCFQSIVLS